MWPDQGRERFTVSGGRPCDQAIVDGTWHDQPF
jgi:hypothetical protein